MLCWHAVLLKLKLVLCFRLYKEYEIRFGRKLLRYMCAKNYQNIAWIDKVITRIKWCSFFDSHGTVPILF